MDNIRIKTIHSELLLKPIKKYSRFTLYSVYKIIKVKVDNEVKEKHKFLYNESFTKYQLKHLKKQKEEEEKCLKRNEFILSL